MSKHLALCLGAAILCYPNLAKAADDEKGQKITVGEGKISLTAPQEWKKREPAFRIIEAEFVVPAQEGDENDGRLTITAATGGVESNIDRWVGQFTQPDGKNTRDVTKSEKITVGEQAVHLVDISGTYKDQRGPMAPAVSRENYRMLAAIIPTKNAGQYFIKLYGPKNTIGANEQAFRKFIESLQVK